MLKKKKVLVLWYSVECNFGDYLIHQTVCSFLESWGYEYISMDVGLPYRQIAQKARLCDWIWFAGGGIIERDIPDVIKKFRKFHHIAGRINYGITGLSIGDFCYDTYKVDLSYWVKNSAFFYTRDDYSSFELNRISQSNRAIASVDVVFASKKMLYNYIDAGDTKIIGVNYRDLPYKDLSGEFRFDEWNNEIQELNSEIYIIPDQHDLNDKMNFKVFEEYSPMAVIKVIEKVEFSISMRYHVILVAAMLGKVSVPICYCPKVRRLAEQLGLQKLQLEVHEYYKLKDVVRYYKENSKELQTVMLNNVNNMRRQADEMFNRVKDKMEVLENEKRKRSLFIKIRSYYEM